MKCFMHRFPGVYRLFIALLFSVVLLSALLGLVAPLRTVMAQQEPQDAPPGLDIILLIDNSTSMRASDPRRIRIRAARMFVDYLNLIAEPEAPSPRVGVISFGGELGRQTPLTRVDRAGSIKKGILYEAIPYTDFPKALEAAYEQLRAGGTFTEGRQGVVILLTDGRPCTTVLDVNQDLCKTTPEEFITGHFQNSINRAVEKLQQQDATLYVLGLGKQAAADEARWTAFAEGSGGRFILVKEADELFDAYRQVLGALATTAPEGPFPISVGSTPLTITTPYPQRVVFSFVQANLQGPASISRTLTLMGPGGLVTATSDAQVRGSLQGGLYQIYMLDAPLAEVFTATLAGEDGVLAWLDVIPPELTVTADAGPHYLGHPLRAEARLLRHGRPVTQPLSMRATWVLPDGAELDEVMVDDDGDGVYVGVLDAAPMTGVYGLEVRAAKEGEEAGRALLTQAFTVTALPTIDAIRLTPSRPPENQPFTITVQVAASHLLRDQIVELRLEDARGATVVEAVVSGAGGRFQHVIAGAPAANDYRLVITIPARAMPVGAGTEQASAFFDVTSQPPPPTPTPRPIIIEVGSIQREGLLYGGAFVTLTHPITISGMNQAEGGLLEDDKDSLRPINPNGDGLIKSVEIPRCPFPSLLPCVRYAYRIVLQGVVDNGAPILLIVDRENNVFWPPYYLIIVLVVLAFVVLFVALIIVFVRYLIRNLKKCRRVRFLERLRRIIKQENVSEPRQLEQIYEELNEKVEDFLLALKSASNDQIDRLDKGFEDNLIGEYLKILSEISQSPDTTIEHIKAFARQGWYQQAAAGVILYRYLTESQEHSLKLELEALAQTMSEPTMLNAWSVAAKLQEMEASR